MQHSHRQKINRILLLILALEIYSDKLIKEGIVSPEDVKSVRDKYEKICEEAFELAKKETHIKVCHLTFLW